jgi:hypothetical protein
LNKIKFDTEDLTYRVVGQEFVYRQSLSENPEIWGNHQVSGTTGFHVRNGEEIVDQMRFKSFVPNFHRTKETRRKAVRNWGHWPKRKNLLVVHFWTVALWLLFTKDDL